MKKTIVVIVILVLAAPGLWFLGRPVYRQHKEDLFLQRAKAFMAKTDYRNAQLSARQVLAIQPTNVAALQIVADLAGLAKSPTLLDVRRRIAEISPTPENRLLLASAALRVSNPLYPLATQILEDLSPSATNLVAYQLVAAELALKLNKTSEAEAHFATASRLEPTNDLHQLNLAVLRLNSTNESTAAAARLALSQFHTNASLGSVALGWLTADSIRRKDWAAAETSSKKLLAQPLCTFQDRLQHLSILQERRSPDFAATLASMKERSSTNAPEIYALSGWLNAHSAAPAALRWLTNLPPAIRAQQPVPLALVDTRMALKDWPGLENYLKSEKWGELEFLRLGLLSQAVLEQHQSTASDAHWHAALSAAGDRYGAMMALVGITEAGKRTEDREEILWRIAGRFPQDRWALRELDRYYLATGNTRGLNRVYETLAAYNPKDLAVRNNFAATSLLLKMNLSRAHELARELHSQRPDDPVITSTYALSLHVGGHTRDGLAAMEKLKPEALAAPSIALYYGLLLSADGQTNNAAKYLTLARSASTLVPEEKALLEQAFKGFPKGP